MSLSIPGITGADRIPVEVVAVSADVSTGTAQAAANASLTAINAKTPPLVGGKQPVDGSGVTQPVSGVFWPAAQPVTGTFWPVTQPVTGTFFQATQPVSIASMPTTPVSGTFFQATQPVSLASAPLPLGAATASNQVLNGVALQGNLTVGVTPVPLRVGATNQSGRKLLIVQGNVTGYTFGYSAALQPFTLSNTTPLFLNISENITVWAVKSSGSNTIAVTEIS